MEAAILTFFKKKQKTTPYGHPLLQNLMGSSHISRVLGVQSHLLLTFSVTCIKDYLTQLPFQSIYLQKKICQKLSVLSMIVPYQTVSTMPF